MNTVKVRIAVAVDRNGNWNAVGYPNKDNSEDGYKVMMSFAYDTVEQGENRYWITAELEIPETKMIKGKVEKENKNE